MKKILIVDDQVEVRELVNVTLDGSDYLIYQCHNGLDAVELTKKEHPDLILMDVMMPGEINGLEAVSRIRQTDGIENTKIIMLTAKGQKDDILKGKAAGANDYFTKPFSPIQLISKVEEMLKS